MAYYELECADQKRGGKTGPWSPVKTLDRNGNVVVVPYASPLARMAQPRRGQVFRWVKVEGDERAPVPVGQHI